MYYDPLTALTQPDTIIPGSGIDPQHLNRYTYVRNNPTTFNDPTGNETVS